MELVITLLVVLAQIAAVMGVVLGHVAYLTYLERKILGDMQDRLGPMEVGPHGLLQPLADGLKLFFKEDIIPTGANKIIFSAAPILSLVPALIGFAVVPFGRDSLVIGDIEITPYITDINVGVLYILAFSSLGAYGVLLGGWASNSKYSLLGGLRSAAQVISYELPLGLSLVGPILLSGSLSMVTMTEAQGGGFWHWYVITQPVAFGIYMICAIAETNRLPFDLPEAESELVAGFMTEYSGMRFSFFFLAEYANMILVSCIAVAVFLGGWQAPFSFLEFIPPIVWFLVKLYALLFFYIWLRATVPRLRFDQLMAFGWKVMLPLSLVNVLLTAVVKYFLNQM
ncbi:MAG: NADH-quinone oxidoreductase subunit NuoH [Nitrospira sp.]|nr:NADH-quinone oxidoreductase subunit NuoH [Candidatus Manganitrophaceae bacterium]HIL35363.1 NADH-quinone oxidoreductase subunit NuoH [Candidatus Manganitrophaceae bacterium]